tara:strand:- start:1585 stop:1740 length:156 start_codon:yes stop_codon:yes gene_type:complete
LLYLKVVDVFPEVVGVDKDGIPDSISYEYLVVPIIAEMKKLRDRVAALESR